jgi:hypothetical protein
LWCEKGENNWLFKVKTLLNRIGFGEVWLFPSSVEPRLFIPTLRLRLMDIYISEWRAKVNGSPSLILFREIKEKFELSKYLLIIENKKHRQYLSKLRLSSHWLNVEYGRRRNIERQNRLFELCEQCTIEDEYHHFVMECSFNNTLRIRYFRVRPSMVKFVELMKTESKPLLYKISLYRPFHLRPYSSCRPWMTSLGDMVDNADTIKYNNRGI